MIDILIIIAVILMFPKNENPYDAHDYEIDENGECYPYTYED